MKVSAYKVYTPFEDKTVKYMTARQARYYDGNGVLTPIEIDIPDRFEPDYTVEGTVVVHVDGVGYFLSEVLGVSHDGKPAIKWQDEDLGCSRSVTLQYETFEKTLRSVW